jgi:hypothetical protein
LQRYAGDRLAARIRDGAEIVGSTTVNAPV